VSCLGGTRLNRQPHGFPLNCAATLAGEADPETMMSETSTDLARRFGGIARLYGADALQRFQQAHVTVVGIGGVGCWAAEALARSAIGRITLIDLDMIAESNVNRQVHALDGEFGTAKVSAMAHRIRAINPACEVREVEDFVTPENVEAILGGAVDYVIDAIDQVRTKAAMIAWSKRSATPLYHRRWRGRPDRREPDPDCRPCSDHSGSAARESAFLVAEGLRFHQRSEEEIRHPGRVFRRAITLSATRQCLPAARAADRPQLCRLWFVGVCDGSLRFAGCR
jgi:hypothetical protein